MQPAVYVADCALGKGLFAARPFAPGAFILTFRGPLFDRADPIHDTPAGANLLQIGPTTYLLPEAPGLYANHSCAPNAGLRRRRLYALAPIDTDEEIRFDYSTTMDEDYWTLACACGAPECRGVIGDFEDLPASLQHRYLERGIVPGFLARRFRLPTPLTPGRTASRRAAVPAL